MHAKPGGPMSLDQIIRKNYQFVLIRSPHELMGYQSVREIFPKVIDLKTTGYRQEYDKHVLPFDSSDFIASHLLLCEKGTKGELIPVLGFKSVTLEKCDAHRISFPMFGMLENETTNEPYKAVLKTILDQHRYDGTSAKIAYNGSFTVLPRLRENKVLMKELWDITFSLLTNYYSEYDIDHVVAICSTKFNVHKKKESLGWNFIQGPSGLLEPYNCRSLFDASFVPMELVGVREKSSVPSSKFKDMWEDRVTYDLEHLSVAEKKAV
jgi:hypothetical protein